MLRTSVTGSFHGVESPKTNDNRGVAAIIEAREVSKAYKLYARAGDRLKELAVLNRRRYHTEHLALDSVSFEVERGETFCIIGENGSGKSTMLQILAGIMEPTRGTVGVYGRVNALLE